MTTTIKSLFALAMVATLGLLVGCDAWEYPSPKLESMVESSTPAHTTTSETLAATGGSYLGKVVEITGTIEHITNKGGQPALTLSGGVICGFGKKQKPMISALHKGERITLRGIYQSTPVGSMGPYLTPCIRVQ